MVQEDFQVFLHITYIRKEKHCLTNQTLWKGPSWKFHIFLPPSSWPHLTACKLGKVFFYRGVLPSENSLLESNWQFATQRHLKPKKMSKFFEFKVVTVKWVALMSGPNKINEIHSTCSAKKVLCRYCMAETILSTREMVVSRNKPSLPLYSLQCIPPQKECIIANFDVSYVWGIL